MHLAQGSLNWSVRRDSSTRIAVRMTSQNRTFEIVANHDGDFWFVSIFEIGQDRRRHLFEYKINHPPDETTACKRGWEIFKKRHLSE